jgi:hypothetical protein
MIGHAQARITFRLFTYAANFRKAEFESRDASRLHTFVRHYVLSARLYAFVRVKAHIPPQWMKGGCCRPVGETDLTSAPVLLPHLPPM